MSQHKPEKGRKTQSDNDAQRAFLKLKHNADGSISSDTISNIENLCVSGVRPRLIVEIGRPGETIKSVNLILRELWNQRQKNIFDVDIRLHPATENSAEEVSAHLKGMSIWRRIADNLRLKFDADESEKLIINVSYRCNNRCGFCSVADRERVDGAFERQIAALDEARLRGVRLLDIDGGEPLLYPKLFDLIRAAQKRGFERITLTSNGRLLSDEKLCAGLAETGADVLVSLHASREDIHDRLVNAPGAWRQSVKGIMNARRLFRRIGINVTVVSENVEDIPRLAALAAKLKADVFNIQLYTPFGECNPKFAPTFERLREFLPSAIDSLKDVMPVYLVNAPHCALPGYEEYCSLDYQKAVRRMLFANGEEVNLAEYLGVRRFKNALCDTCPQDSVCGGFWDYGTDPDTGEKYRIRMLDVIAGYPCDANCPFCAIDDDLWTNEMNTAEVRRCIDSAMIYGPSLLRFGGGEPTIRPDFFELLRYAATMNFERVSVQTHGFRLAGTDFVRNMAECGCNKVNVSVRGHIAATHESLTGVPGSFELLQKGIRNVIADGRMQLEIDMIVSRLNYRTLSDELRFFHELGARRFNMWFISLEGRARKRADELAARMSEAAPYVMQACETSRSLKLETLKVYYLPYCFMKGFEEFVWHPLDENVLVISPGADFKLDRGKIDIGVKPPPCDACAMRKRCFGLAPAYMQHFGFDELSPYEKAPKKL